MNLCPRCGGVTQENSAFCSYCGVELPKPLQPNQHTEHNSNVSNTNNSHTIVHNYYNATPQQQTTVHYIPVATEAPKKKHTFWKILGWLFVFPLMVTLIAVRKKKWYWWLLAIISWFVYLSMGSSSRTGSAISYQPLIQTVFM